MMQIDSKEIKSFTATNNTVFTFIKLNGEKVNIDADSKSKPFILQTITSWIKLNRERAKKVTFDYINEDRTFFLFLLFLNWLIMGGVGAIFLTDAVQSLKCNKALTSEESLITEAKINKITKNRKANIVWDLNFTDDLGNNIVGKRIAVNPDSANHTPGKNTSVATVIYSKENRSCWDLSVEFGKKHLPIGQRTFIAHFTFGFGMFFTLMCVVLSVYLGKKAYLRRPFTEEIKEIYQSI